MKKILILIFLFSLNLAAQTESQSFYRFKVDAVNQITENSSSESPFVFDEVQKKKSTGLAILYSLLLPGMGELYAESYNSGMYFTIADGVLWGTYLGMNVYGNWQKDRYISFAESKAGVNVSGKSDEYFATIGSYLDIDQYNNEKALERSYKEMYNSSDYYWKWGSNDDRKTYRSMWTSSEQTFNNLRFVAGALIINRLVSAINAVRLVAAYNKNMSQEVSWNVYMSVNNQPDLSNGLVLNFTTQF